MNARPRLFRLDREHLPLSVTGAALAGFLAFKACNLYDYPDLFQTYPWAVADSFEWILEAVRLRGHHVPTWGRNPGFPCVLAILDAVLDMRYLPLVNVPLLGWCLIELSLLLRLRFTPAVVALVLALFGFGFGLQTLFEYVLADPWAMAFQLAAIRQLALARTKPRRLFLAAAAAAVSFHFQYAVACLAPAFAIFYFVAIRPAQADRRRTDLDALFAAALGLAIVAPPLVYKAVVYKNPFFSLQSPFPLFELHFFGVPFYLFNAAAFFGLPAALLAAYGAVRSLRRPAVGTELLIDLSAICLVAFWVFFYDWLDPRFLIYGVPVFAWMAAEGAEALALPAALHPSWQALPRTLAAWTFCIGGVLLAAHDRIGPLARNSLPLTPQNELVTGMREITRFGGNVTIDLAGLQLVSTDGMIGAQRFLHYYQDARKHTDRTLARDLAREYAAVARSLGDAEAGHCGTLPKDGISVWRREIALRRTEWDCAPDRPALYAAGDDTGSAQLLFRGSLLKVAARPAPSRTGASSKSLTAQPR
jgi:hypothetical protein